MRSLFLSFLLLVSGSVFAQIPIKSRWNLGADLGTAFNRMTTKDLTLDKGHWGVTAGLTVNYTFKRNVVCEAGVRVTDKGSKELRGFDPQYQHFIASLTLDRLYYFEIPVMVGYQFKLPKGVSIIPKAGVYYSIGFKGWGNIANADDTFGAMVHPFDDGGDFTLDGGQTQSFMPYERLDRGFLLGADIKFKQVVCRITYGRSISHISNSYDTSNRHQTLSMSLGYYLFRR